MKRKRNLRFPILGKSNAFKGRIYIVFLTLALCAMSLMFPLFFPVNVYAASDEDVTVLRVCNWEEYIDLGGWEEEERIDLDNGASIFGEKPLYEEFEEWYYENYGKKVKVEYSCAGTNEELYSQLKLGDTYDLVCPSDYMIMKLMSEDMVEPFSDSFFDKENPLNYYTNGVSPYIQNVFSSNKIGGESWDKYASCYMWGTTGILYNPKYMTQEEASTWSVFSNPKFYRQLTLKDNVRDTLFAAIGCLKQEELLSMADTLDEDSYTKYLADAMNDTSQNTVESAQDLLQDMMGNIYALETDSGKADMITGKIVGSYQWSGDAVYAMDQAEEDGVELSYAVPIESTNLWFDGWIMLKKGIADDLEKKQAAEAFVNFLSRPDNVVRNMYYIGYTSAISGGDDDTIFSYLNWCYGSDIEDIDMETSISYPLGYFFSGNEDDANYIVYIAKDQVNRQLYTQYPSKEVISRAAIMGYFDDEEAARINQMWINIRCFNISDVTMIQWIVISIIIIAFVGFIIWKRHYKSYKS